MKYYLAKKYRKRGYGLAIFQKALEHCNGCTIGLAAVSEQVENYKKIGFSISENVKFYMGKATHCNVDLNIIPYNEEKHFQDVASYDKNCFPGDRKDFLKSWLVKPNTYSFVYYENNILKGYASIYKSNDVWDISPCCCDSYEIAKALIGALVNQIDEQSDFEFSVTESNKFVANLINEISDVYNLNNSPNFSKMYKNGTPNNFDVNKCFCYVSIAIG